ncbi:signal peptide peptidase SppA [Halovenus sp. WSH3]|uniref:Signal peptide peptidase SppA n=1 Tax=Halovenus carboxidivorans TaxID=2692199 RepID=A0A6B0T7G0_9EURY|nr:signal peptide peptidase SppA [Halovenus carboxidivorans]MXR51131.1 signal peptide peptidase SppA [Halovenus carboxidivorans]
MGLKSALRVVLFAGVAAVGVAAVWLLFLWYPSSGLELAGVLLLVLAAPLVVRVAGSVASSIVPSYNVAEVGVTGAITRTASGGIGSPPTGASADRIVEQIERADADSSVDALLVRLNTPGGEIVPSEDIKLAAEEFDGPTLAYATDTCASGGYEIASGCDEIWARDGSIVGSIGVIGSRVTAAELADRLGIQYEQLTAGEYKDAGTPLKELEDHEREYLQGLIDEYYEQFVSNVAERREMDAETIEETEARVYIGTEAKEQGLVDELGTKDDVTDALEERLGTDVSVREFEPQFPLAQRVQLGAQRFAFAFGAGLASIVTGENNRFKFR